MSYKKENLEKLVMLVKEIISTAEDDWFITELSKVTGNGKQPLTKEMLSFDSFVKMQRRTYRLKANEFYRNVYDCTLKTALCRDYQEMLWFKMLNLVDRYYLYVYYQLENMLNYYVLKNNGFEKIKSSPDSYHCRLSEKFTVKCYDYFFSKGVAKDITTINSIWAKLAFWGLETNNVEWLIKNNSTIFNITNIRNLVSHRNSAVPDDEWKEKIEGWKKGDDSAYSFPVGILNTIKKSL